MTTHVGVCTARVEPPVNRYITSTDQLSSLISTIFSFNRGSHRISKAFYTLLAISTILLIIALSIVEIFEFYLDSLIADRSHRHWP